jgi:ADP-heptose:LPS heptosyltransferase
LSHGGRALLVYRPGALGDALVALPAIRLARAYFNPAVTILATSPAAVPLLAENGVAEHVISADDARLAPLFIGDTRRFAEAFGSIQAAVLWGGDALSCAASALRAIGVHTVHAPSRPPEDGFLHVTDYLVSTIPGGGCACPSWERLTPSSDDLAWLEDQHGEVVRRGVFTIHTGSGSPRKNWAPTAFADVANRMRQEEGLAVGVISGPADDEADQQLQSALAGPPDILASDWPLGRVAALLSRSRVYLGNDSGISHMAGCLGVRGVALFGPTRPQVWRPNGGTIVALKAPEIADHQPETVLNALQEILSSKSGP